MGNYSRPVHNSSPSQKFLEEINEFHSEAILCRVKIWVAISAYFFHVVVNSLVSGAFAMDIKPNHTIYINNLNEKTKKEGTLLVISLVQMWGCMRQIYKNLSHRKDNFYVQCHG